MCDEWHYLFNLSSVISVFQEPVKQGTAETILKVYLTVVLIVRNNLTDILLNEQFYRVWIIIGFNLLYNIDTDDWNKLLKIWLLKCSVYWLEKFLKKNIKSSLLNIKNLSSYAK
jgi:hypothetical protein